MGAISVHKDAILYRSQRSLVVRIENGNAGFRPVRLGKAIGERFIVEDGLQTGDLVVVRGNERLRPGQGVRLINPEAAVGETDETAPGYPRG